MNRRDRRRGFSRGQMLNAIALVKRWEPASIDEQGRLRLDPGAVKEANRAGVTSGIICIECNQSTCECERTHEQESP